MSTRVVNKYKDTYTVYIRWGNPYIVGRDGGREEVFNILRK